MTRIPITLIVATLFAVFLSAAAQAVAVRPAAATAPPCTWATEYNRTLDELREDRALWRAGDLADNAWGETSEEGAVVNPLAPCEYVADVVRHEHMHLQQARQFGSLRFAAVVLGLDRIELVADCASLLAGSRYTPYVVKAGGCSPRDLADARQLLRYRR